MPAPLPPSGETPAEQTPENKAAEEARFRQDSVRVRAFAGSATLPASDELLDRMFTDKARQKRLARRASYHQMIAAGEQQPAAPAGEAPATAALQPGWAARTSGAHQPAGTGLDIVSFVSQAHTHSRLTHLTATLTTATIMAKRGLYDLFTAHGARSVSDIARLTQTLAPHSGNRALEVPEVSLLMGRNNHGVPRMSQEKFASAGIALKAALQQMHRQHAAEPWEQASTAFDQHFGELWTIMDATRQRPARGDHAR